MLYAECFYCYLKKLFTILVVFLTNISKQRLRLYKSEEDPGGTTIKMTSQSSSSTTITTVSQIYKFKPYVFEEIKPFRPSKNSRVPYARSGHRIAADTSHIYSFGGYNPISMNEEIENDEYWVHTFPLFQELWKFNMATKEWNRYPNFHTLPQELASNAMLLHQNILMVFGGTGSPFGFRCSNQLYVCRVNDEKGIMEEIHTTGQHPLPCYGQALIYHNDYLYVIGGTNGIIYTCDIHRLNFKTLTWEIVNICNGTQEYEPKGRYRHEVAFNNNKIYILGGGTALDAYGFKEIPVFDLNKYQWYPQKTIKDKNHGRPQRRRCHGAVQLEIGNSMKVFIVGGHDGQYIYDDLWMLDLITFQWTFFEKCFLPDPTYFHAAAVSPQGRLYVFGGVFPISENNVLRNNTLYSTWLCIPKLSELCWEAVLHYWPHIVKSKCDDLIDAGFPKNFIKRIGNQKI